jgi:ElaB/YqjD/DUF883 family membrane-anchored ribosome-binding protein
MASTSEGTKKGAAASERAHTTDQLASAAHETVDRVARNAADAERQIRAKAGDLADKARDTEERAKERAEASLSNARDFVEQNPLLSTGIAFVVGMTLSSLLRR